MPLPPHRPPEIFLRELTYRGYKRQPWPSSRGTALGARSSGTGGATRRASLPATAAKPRNAGGRPHLPRPGRRRNRRRFFHRSSPPFPSLLSTPRRSRAPPTPPSSAAAGALLLPLHRLPLLSHSSFSLGCLLSRYLFSFPPSGNPTEGADAAGVHFALAHLPPTPSASPSLFCFLSLSSPSFPLALCSLAR